jgi:hypothetical protein
VKPFFALVLLSLIIMMHSYAAEFQSMEAGVRPLRQRLAAVRAEAASLRITFDALRRGDERRVAIAKRLAALDAEEKKLTADLNGAEQWSRSPNIMYESPSSEKRGPQ